MKSRRTGWIVGLGTGLIAVAGAAFAADPPSTEALAAAAQNPLANMISLPFQNNTTFNVGPDDEVLNVLNIQPVIPIEINHDWNLITRTILPVISQPGLSGQDRVNGIGDTQVELWISPSAPGKLIWGVGPVVQFPTTTNDALGTKKWGAGPSLVLFTSAPPWRYGVIANNIWSFGGPDGATPINQLLIQPILNYNFKEGWYLVSAPIITANWKAHSNDVWTVPLGGGFGRIFKLGKQAFNGQMQAFYNVESPEHGGNWTVRLQLQLLFPK